MTVGSRIKEARKRAGMSVKRLAQLADLAPTTIYDLERGDSDSTTRLPAIAAALQINALWLERGQGPREADVSVVRDAAIPVYGERTTRAMRMAEEITKLEKLDPKIADAFETFVMVVVARLKVRDREAKRKRDSDQPRPDA